VSTRLHISLLALSSLLTACGQRGALFLPEEDRAVVVTPVQPEATPEATEEQRRNTVTPPAN
jgi:predicted small lipoprotein YifL